MINQLVASMLWHRLTVLSPPPEFVARVQRKLTDFFWAGKHWVSAGVLSLPLAEGGQGLVCIRTQVHTFRLQTLQRYLYADPAPQWCALASLLLRQLHRLGYDRQLFWLDLPGIRLPELPVFYRDLLKTRSMFSIGRDAVPTEGEEFISNPTIQTVPLCQPSPAPLNSCDTQNTSSHTLTI